MDYYKKRNIIDKTKKNWKPILATGILITIAGIVMLVGCAINGWNLVKWWNQGYGPTCVIVIIVGGLAGFFFWYFLDLIKTKRK